MNFGKYEMQPGQMPTHGYVTDRYVLDFSNGYSVSIVRGTISRGLWELAVMLNDDLTYDTPVTNDVERGDEERMADLIAQVEALPAPMS